MKSLVRPLVLAVVVAATSCAQSSPTDVGRTQQRLATGARDTGLIPYPVISRPEDGTPPASSWDGTLAELVAADALALCLDGTIQGIRTGADATLDRLMARMSSALCPEVDAPIAITTRWRNQRTLHPECNADPTSGAPATLPIGTRDHTNYVIDSDLSIPIADTAHPDSVLDHARDQLGVADVNLCMAQMLREHLSTADGLFMSAQENLELLALIRERAQIAMLQYALLGRVIASPESGNEAPISHDLMSIPVLKLWASTLSDVQLQELGIDFLLAIRLHAQTTQELAEFLVRTPLDGVGDSSAEKVWGPMGGRQRLLRLLYGGDLLAPPQIPEPMPDLEDVRAPEVEILLGLAKQADGLGYYGRFDSTVGWPTLARAESGDRILRTTEADLRNRDCLIEDPNANCDLTWNDPSVPGAEDFVNSLLFQRYRITPDHAEQLAALFASSMTRRDNYGRLHVVGEHERSGSLDAQFWIRVDPDFTIASLGPEILARSYANEYRLAMPGTLTFLANPREQGFDALWEPVAVDPMPRYGFGNSAMRLAGAITALTAVRHQILRATGGPPTGMADYYFKCANEALSLIEAAVGTRTVATVPATTLTSYSFPMYCGSWALGTNIPTSCPVLKADTNGLRFEVVTTPADPATTVALGPWKGDESTAALAPNYRSPITGYTRATLLSSLPAYSLATIPVGAERARRILDTTSALGDFVLLGRYTNQDSLVVYEPLVARSERRKMGYGPVNLAGDALHLAYGGRLTQIAMQAFALNPRNWSQPRYDGFGLPIDWVPPADPAIIGAQAGESAVDYYLRTARDAAAAARDSVQTTIASLLEESLDQTMLETSRERAQSLDQLEERALCGDQELPCAPRERVVAQQRLDVCSGSPEITMKCGEFYDYFYQAAGSGTYDKEILEYVEGQGLGDEDAMRRRDTPPLGLNPFRGGLIYDALLAHWRAVNTVRSTLDSALQAALAQAWASYTADMVLEASSAAEARLCTGSAFSNAILAGRTYLKADYVLDWGLGQVTIDSGAKLDNTFNAGPLIAAWNACAAAMESLPAAEAQQGAVNSSAYLQMLEYRTAIARAVADVALTDGELGRLYGQLEIVKARNAVEVAAMNAEVETRIGFKRRYQSYDVWRARALLENARRLAVAARRAIESRYAVDLSRMRAPEAFVDSPANWADEIYVPDLSIPAAVGLSVRPDDGGSGIYPNKIEDYVRNLELFVQGYSVTRPAASTHSDSEVLTLDGPEATVESACNDTAGTTCDPAGCLHVQHLASGPVDDNHLRPLLRLVNNGAAAIALNELEVRYWFTTEGTSSIATACDWATMGCSQATLAVTTVNPAVTGANRVLSVTFQGAPSLQPGAFVELQLRLNKIDWSNFAELDDYSYAAGTVFASNTKVALYRSGTLVWGTEPDGLATGDGCEEGETVGHLGTQAGLWSYWCEDSDRWIAHPGLGQRPLVDRLATACSGAQPTKARLVFLLDPWGRILGDVAEPPMEARFNGRWQRFAVNLVGTGIRDCAEASDPTACYTEAFLRFDLQHTGRVWVANYDGEWWPLAVPTALVEGGKAIAQEEWLDPLTHGWNLPFVTSAGRQELVGRPLGGDYALTIDIPPGTRLDRVERIQVLLETDYWVRQEL